jgi:hypothetical protein
MHRPTLLVGLGLIVLMCLVPPFNTGAVDDVADALRGEEVTRVEYHPIWARPDTGDGVVSALREWEIAGSRLLLQIVGVALVTGILAYWLED